MWHVIEATLSERVYKFRPVLTQTWSVSSRMVVFASTDPHNREFVIIKPFRWGTGWSPWDEHIAPDGVICRSFRCDRHGIRMTDERHVALEDIHEVVMPWILRLVRPVLPPIRHPQQTKSLMFRCFCSLTTRDIGIVRTLILPHHF